MNRLGHFGYVLLWSGQMLLALGHSEGWAIRVAGELIWLWIGVRLKMNSIWFWGIVGVAVEAYGWLAWTGRI